MPSARLQQLEQDVAHRRRRIRSGQPVTNKHVRSPLLKRAAAAAASRDGGSGGARKPPPPPRLVNVTSAAGLCCSPGLAPYHASKFAAEALSSCLRLELGGPCGCWDIPVRPSRSEREGRNSHIQIARRSDARRKRHGVVTQSGRRGDDARRVRTGQWCAGALGGLPRGLCFSDGCARLAPRPPRAPRQRRRRRANAARPAAPQVVTVNPSFHATPLVAAADGQLAKHWTRLPPTVRAEYGEPHKAALAACATQMVRSPQRPDPRREKRAGACGSPS